MAGQLTNPVSSVIRQLLLDLDVVDEVSPWPIFIANMPGEPSNLVVVYDTAGKIDGRTMYDGEIAEQYGIQVKVRGVNYQIAFAKIAEIVHLLDTNVNNNYVVVNGKSYKVQTISRTGTILRMGSESPTSQRQLIVVNALVSLRECP